MGPSEEGIDKSLTWYGVIPEEAIVDAFLGGAVTVEECHVDADVCVR